MIDELGLFETLLAIEGRVLHAEEHCQRMLASARALSFPLPDAQSFLRKAANAAKRVSEMPEAAVRCVYAAPHGTDWRLTASAGPIPAVTLRRRHHGRVITLSHSRALPEHKLTAYAASAIGLREAIAKGADEGLFLDRQGRVLEGTATNVFALHERTLITAPVSAGILPGIMRANVIATAERAGFSVIERPPTLDELRQGSFLTSSLTRLAPIRVLDGLECTPPLKIAELLSIAGDP